MKALPLPWSHYAHCARCGGMRQGRLVDFAGGLGFAPNMPKECPTPAECGNALRVAMTTAHRKGPVTE
jgi:hypothetical protein